MEETKRKKNKTKPLNQKNEYFRLLKPKCVAYKKNILILFVKLINLIFSLRQLTEIFLWHIEDTSP